MEAYIVDLHQWDSSLLVIPISIINIIRNEVTFLYVLLECFKWISMYFKANNAINAYNIDSL